MFHKVGDAGHRQVLVHAADTEQQRDAAGLPDRCVDAEHWDAADLLRANAR
jgi:hypothetical protein